MYNSHFLFPCFCFYVIFFSMYGTALLSKFQLYCIAYGSVLHVRVLPHCVNLFRVCVFLHPEKKCIMAYCILYRNALHFSSSVYCICFFACTYFTGREVKGESGGGAHFFVWHLIEGRLFFRMCFLNMRFVFDFNFFYELYVFYLLFYRFEIS